MPGLEPPPSEAGGTNIGATKKGSPIPRKAKVGAKNGDRDIDADKDSRRPYMDVDEVEGVEDAESDAGQAMVVVVAAAAAVTEEPEEEEEREVKARAKVNLGTFVYPRLPFPYFFDLGRGIPTPCEKNEVAGESKGKEAEVENKEDAEKIDLTQAETKQIEVGEKEDAIVDAEENKSDQRVANDAMDVDVKEKKAEDPAVVKEDKDLLDLETRVTIIIPNGHIPHEKPSRPRIWGGGLP